MKDLHLMRGWGSVGLGWEWVNPEICVGSVGVAASRDEGPGAREIGGLRHWGGDGGCQQDQGFAVAPRRRDADLGVQRRMMERVMSRDEGLGALERMENYETGVRMGDPRDLWVL